MSVDPGVDIGHVHLKVSDIDRALAFYVGVLGFEEQARMGDQAAFVSAGGYHHHIGLNTWESKGGSPPPPGTTGLFHFAIRYPTRRALADALRRLRDGGIALHGASDHGVSEALYLPDPDQNGIELYWTGRRKSGRGRTTGSRSRCTRGLSTCAASSPSSTADARSATVRSSRRREGGSEQMIVTAAFRASKLSA